MLYPNLRGHGNFYPKIGIGRSQDFGIGTSLLINYDEDGMHMFPFLTSLLTCFEQYDDLCQMPHRIFVFLYFLLLDVKLR